MEKELYRKIRHINRYKIRWVLLWLLMPFICFAISSPPENDSLAISYIVSGFVLCVLFPLEYYWKFNNIMADRHYKDANIVGDFYQQVKLTAIMKCHSFSAKRYVKLLAIRLVPFQIVVVLLNVLITICNRDTMSATQNFIELGIAMAAIVFPVAVGLLYYKYMEHELTEERDEGMEKKLKNMGLAFGVDLAEYGCGISCLIYFCLFVVFGLLDSVVVWSGVQEVGAVCISYEGDTQIFSIMSLFLAFLYLMWDQGDVFSLRIIGKIRVVVGIALVAMLICYPVNSILNHIELREDKISVVKNGRTETYGLNDITGFRIYPHNDGLKMDVDFSDGTQIGLFRDTTSANEEWNDRFQVVTDYDKLEYFYAEYLTEYLTEQGIKGELESADKLRRTAEEYEQYNPKMIEAIEEIEKCVSDQDE